MKQCFRCKTEKPLTDFYNNQAKDDGKFPACKDCMYRPKQERRGDQWSFITLNPVLVRRAKDKWKRLKKRCCDGKDTCYEGVGVRIDLVSFIQWFVPELETFYRRFPYEVPSVNRIDSSKHYEAGNLEVISHWENSWRNNSNPYQSDKAKLQAAVKRAIKQGHLTTECGQDILDRA